MKAELRRSIFLACVGLLGGFTLVVTLYGASELFKQGFGAPEGRAAPLATEPAPSRGEGSPVAPGKPRSDRSPGPGQMSALSSGDNPAAPGGVSPPAGGEASAPTFDIIRVEPSGETVIAGRAAPNTTVEMLRDNEPIARVLVDPSGQFAIVPPALSPGSSEITLRSTGADGRSLVSRESVAVVVAAKRDAKPLIALTSPDKPTVVLSQPDPAAPAQAAADPRDGDTTAKGDTKTAAKGDSSKGDSSKADPKSPAQADARPSAKPEGTPVKIVSVEAEEGGRLYVTSQAQPGATVRLYLNDTLVAPGSAGADGRVAFTIGRGVQPGAYAIRVDQVDPVSGKVKTRSEVAFTVPVPASKPAGIKPAAAKPAPVASAAPAPAGPGPSTPPAKIALLPQPLKADPPRTGATLPTPAMTGPGPRPGTESQAPESQVPEPKFANESKVMPEPKPAPEAPRTVFVPEIGTARIVRGDSLWQISRRTYGSGTRYTVIYDANQPQIRNPDRIYPGQIFVLPTDGTAAVTGAQRRG
ncbi:LysM peptidoglycan-binding domain-containing protein [Methylobacterium sp. J-090]|uniref:LysM peptidoglycan-binding domain-containing protein n=1 Tax=Methylobacterium sp. J-090 TaxID=2836666 RepID=UPI001FB8D9BD|nr:LysM peptidoglycan-binding domain-containing protein [Methylobacterium sp. J-090]MCJ2081672.1 LysM peptidoglycan-binding domain-containing protein [Methylobacterium sp. J-090]